MKIIDINCMLGTWPSEKLRFSDNAGLLREMDSYNISTGIAFSSIALWSPERGNQLINEAVAASNGRVKACYILDPILCRSDMSWESSLLIRIKKEKPSAVKLYPNRNCFTLDSFYCGEFLEMLNELSMPILFDADQAPSFEKLPDLARTYKNIKFIILRHSMNRVKYTIPIIKKLDNVYFDTSVMADTGLIEEIVNKYGSEKLLFGSGIPFYVPAGALALVLYSRIREGDKEKILSLNWENIERGIRYDDQTRRI